ncbi:MAG TPA: CcmD family protein [Methanosarcinales archaeon]|nr:CcmD family protein [Methanosarcinales archaeon]
MPYGVDKMEPLYLAFSIVWIILILYLINLIYKRMQLIKELKDKLHNL